MTKDPEMYKNIHNYRPFEHGNVDFKNNLINLGRNQDKTKVEGAFSAVLIYANLVDYLAKSLLDNLLRMVSLDSFLRFGGAFFYDGSRKKTNKPLGSLTEELEYFEFPNKTDFLECLRTFNTLRKGLIHNLMQLDLTGATNKLDDDIKRVGEIAEDILSKYNAICGSITTIWNTVHPQQTIPAGAGQPNSSVDKQ